MERYRDIGDFDTFKERMSKKTDEELEFELDKIKLEAEKLRCREFVGYKMTPRVSQKLDVLAQQRMKIETIIYEREQDKNEN